MTNEELVLNILRVFDAPVEKVFEAWSSQALMEKWCAPGEMTATIELDFKEGGAFQVAMKEPSGKVFTAQGSFSQIIPNKKLVYSWKWTHEVYDTKITVLFKDLGNNKTEVSFTHQGFDTQESKSEHNKGWIGCLDKLERSLT